MKNTLIITLMLLTISLQAQPHKKGKKYPKFTPEQVAELQTKKMTLQLDLTKNQQDKVFSLHKEIAIKRQEKRAIRKTLGEKREKPSDEVLFERRSMRLDVMIAHQNKMKTILEEKQFEAWKKRRRHKMHRVKNKSIQQHHKKGRKG